MKTLLDGIFTYALMAFLPALLALILATSAHGATPSNSNYEAPAHVLTVFGFKSAVNTPFGVWIATEHSNGFIIRRGYMWDGFRIVSYAGSLNPAWKQANGM